MKIIDNQNLDEWLFDYFEGNLKADEKERLIHFLHKNPALKADYDAWKSSYVQEPEIIYPGMDSLLQKGGSNNKWMKWGLSGLILISLLSIYLFNQQKDIPTPKSKMIENVNKAPIEQNNIQIEKTSVSEEKNNTLTETPKEKTIAAPLTEKEKTNKTAPLIIKNTEAKKERPIAPPIKETNTATITPKETEKSIETQITKPDSIINKQTNNIVNEKEPEKKLNNEPTDQPKKKDKKLKEKKEMKIIKLKSIGF